MGFIGSLALCGLLEDALLHNGPQLQSSTVEFGVKVLRGCRSLSRVRSTVVGKCWEFKSVMTMPALNPYIYNPSAVTHEPACISPEDTHARCGSCKPDSVAWVRFKVPNRQKHSDSEQLHWMYSS